MIYAGFHFVKSSTVKYFNRNDKTSEGPYLARFIFIPRHRFRDRAPDNLFAFVLSPLQLQPLYRVLVQEHFQRLGCGGVVVVQQRFVELLHVLIPDGQDAHSGLQQDGLFASVRLVRLLPSQKSCPRVPQQKAFSAFSVAEVSVARIAASSARTAASCGTCGV